MVAVGPGPVWTDVAGGVAELHDAVRIAPTGSGWLDRWRAADAALAAISERGYANTGLREIAEHSPLSHGSLHYYFEGKDDLVAQAVWQYKSECARHYDTILETAVTADELSARVAAAMRQTLVDEASLHRLWYDLRNQALFDTGFGDTIVRIDALLDLWPFAEAFQQLYLGPALLLDAEKNASAPLPTGTSAGALATAQAASAAAPSAPIA